MTTPVLELVDVSKSFRRNWSWQSVQAVDQLSFALHEGEIFGLIGHNGAGKTTTFKLLIGLLRPTRGTLLWGGAPIGWDRPRPDIGFSPEQPYFYDYLTVHETLHFYGRLYGLATAERRARIDELVEEFGIGRKLDAPMRTLSKGTLQRVAVAQAIMHRPRLVILDEPMSGLDPVGRKRMRDLIAALRRSGTTVLFSSHILSDAEALCDRIGILWEGRLREVVDLRQEHAAPTGYTLVFRDAPSQALERLSRMATEPPSGGPDRWTVTFADIGTAKAALTQLDDARARVEALLSQRPSLEQRFLRYSRNGADVD